MFILDEQAFFCDKNLTIRCFYGKIPVIEATYRFIVRLFVKAIIMRTILLFFAFSCFSFLGMAQSESNQTNTPAFFAQCLMNITTESELTALETQLRAIPYVRVVRVDIPTHRLFLITKDLNALSVNDFNSWLGSYSSSYDCLQIGLHGVDSVNPYPFTNCNN